MADDTDIGATLSTSLDITRELKTSTDALGRSITNTFARGVVEGKRFEDMLGSIGKSLISIGLKAALKPVEAGLQNLFGSLLSGNLFGGSGGAPLNILPNAKGGAFNVGRVTPFASGGVVSQPTFFPMRGGLGLMGERGAEAVMPLSRGSDGRLGVRAQGGSAVNVTVNIATPDVESFRRSEAQISGALARAVQRGRRGT